MCIDVRISVSVICELYKVLLLRQWMILEDENRIVGMKNIMSSLEGNCGIFILMDFFLENFNILYWLFYGFSIEICACAFSLMRFIWEATFKVVIWRILCIR